MTDLIPLESPDPLALFVRGGLEPILARIESEARSIIADVGTAKGRDVIRSNAANVARAKTYLDGIGKEYVAELKNLPKQVDAERRAMRDRLDALRDEVRAPLTAYEQAETARVERHKAALAELQAFAEDLNGLPPSVIEGRIAAAESVAIGPVWEEYAPEAAATHQMVLRQLRAALIVERDLEARKLAEEQARREQEEAETREREERIAREAAEAATRAAEERARREAEEAAAKAQAEIDRARREAEEQQRRAEQAERDRIAAEERARAEEKARHKQAEREEQKRREDREHAARVHNEIVAALVATSGWIDEEMASEIVRAIASKKIPHISISY